MVFVTGSEDEWFGRMCILKMVKSKATLFGDWMTIITMCEGYSLCSPHIPHGLLPCSFITKCDLLLNSYTADWICPVRNR